MDTVGDCEAGVRWFESRDGRINFGKDERDQQFNFEFFSSTATFGNFSTKAPFAF